MAIGYLGKHTCRAFYHKAYIVLLVTFLLGLMGHIDAQTTNPIKKASSTHTTKPKKDSLHAKNAIPKVRSHIKTDTTKKTIKKIVTPSVAKKTSSLVKIDSAVIKKNKIATKTKSHSTPSLNALAATQVADLPQKQIHKKDLLWEKITAVPYLPLKAKPIYVMDEPHPYESKDVLFFTVCGLMLLFGLVRTAFPKYTGSLFKNLISFSAIDKSDYSMGQNNLPSLLLNILFCLSVGLLAALIIDQLGVTQYALWQIWLAGSLALAAIYFVKFITIYASGWIFNASPDANAYMYVVFLINKLIGVLCLPAILIFAFAENPVLNNYIITIGSILLIVLLIYRYIITFSVIARNLQLNAFHFFLYLCSVEIIPILLLYKLFSKDLINWIS